MASTSSATAVEVASSRGSGGSSPAREGGAGEHLGQHHRDREDVLHRPDCSPESGRTPQRLGTVAGPVAFLNTSADDPALQGADVAGRYTVTVFLARKPGGRSIPVPFRLALGVSSTPQGEPAFASASPSPSAEASPTQPGSSGWDEPTDSSASAGDSGGGFSTSLALGAPGSCPGSGGGADPASAPVRAGTRRLAHREPATLSR